MKLNWMQLSLLLSVVLTVNVYADTDNTMLQPLGSIEQTAYEFALEQAQARNYDNPQITVESLDSRLRLQACDSKLKAFTNNSNTAIGSQTIGVQCHSPIPWTVYVPSKVKVLKTVVVAARPLAAKQLIRQSDVKLQQIDIGSLRQGYLKNTHDVIGQKLKYPIAMGAVVNPNGVRPQKIVHRGEQILLVAIAGNMEVRMNGTALSDAGKGQRIRVKNSSSKRVVEGVVEAPGIVKVTM